MIIIADRNGTTDAAYHTLVKHLRVDLPIVMVSWAENFIFNEELLNIKDYCLVCYCEYGYDHDFSKTGTHIWGKNSENFPRYYNRGWIAFDNWVKNNPPKIVFKRELLQKDRTESILPIDYPATFPAIPIQSEEEFNNRPVSGFMYFGRSHEDRLRLHSDIWRNASKYGYSVCDNIYLFEGFMANESGKKYISVHVPHYERLPLENILYINGKSKIGVVPFGAGQKTFRAAEVSANAVMLMWEDDLAWQEDWTSGVNCLKCKPGMEVEAIEKYVNDPILYQIYQRGVETWKQYHVGNYIPRLEKIINESIHRS